MTTSRWGSPSDGAGRCGIFTALRNTTRPPTPSTQPTKKMFQRLRKEAADAQRSTEPDLVLAPQQDNLQSWRAWVAGPTDTPFEGGVFELELNIGVRYPLAPPVVRVTTPLFHPNIHDRTGEVCLDILKEAWSPAWTLVSGTGRARGWRAERRLPLNATPAI